MLHLFSTWKWALRLYSTSYGREQRCLFLLERVCVYFTGSRALITSQPSIKFVKKKKRRPIQPFFLCIDSHSCDSAVLAMQSVHKIKFTTELKMVYHLTVEYSHCIETSCELKLHWIIIIYYQSTHIWLQLNLQC